MLTRIAPRSIVFALLSAFAVSTVLAHEISVHHRLSLGAVHLARSMNDFLDDLGMNTQTDLRAFDVDDGAPLSTLIEQDLELFGLKNGFPLVAGEAAQFRWDPLDLVRAGSITEDGGRRVLNHFYSPTTIDGGKELAPPFPYVAVGASLFTFFFHPADAKYWALSKADNAYGWKAAMDNLYKALTYARKEERDQYLAKVFYDLGHMIHLVQDMTQPSHTRNDPHACIFSNHSPYINPRTCAAFEKFFTDFPRFVDDLVGVTETGKYGGVPIFRTSAQYFWDLADFSAVNFFSDHTIDLPPQLREVPDFPPSLDPALDTAREGADAPPSPVYVRNVSLDGPKNRVARICLAPSYPNAEPLTIDDPGVLLDTAAVLYPKAVLYSAGLLDYFFRARLKVLAVTPPSTFDPNAEYDLVTYSFTNASAYPSTEDFDVSGLHGISSETLKAFADLTTGERVNLTVEQLGIDDMNGAFHLSTELAAQVQGQTPQIETVTVRYPRKGRSCGLPVILVFDARSGDAKIGSEQGITAIMGSTASECANQAAAASCPIGHHLLPSGFQGGIAAKTGDRGLRTLDMFPSINDSGMIAFTGRDTNGGGAFVVNKPGDPPKRVTFYASTRDFQGAAINSGAPPADSEIVSVDNIRDSSAYFVRRWRTDGPPNGPYAGTVVARSSSGAFNSTTRFVDINEGDTVAFMAVKESFPSRTLFVYDGVSLQDWATFPITQDRNEMCPSLSDNGRIVVGTAGGQLLVYSGPGVIDNVVAGPSTGFTTVGIQPAFSPDGRFVAFVGDLSLAGATLIEETPGVGVFTALDRTDHWEIHRVAGVSGNSYLDPGETCLDRNANQVCDLNPNDPAHSDIDQGLFASFLLDERLGVNNQGLVVFLAIGTDGSKGVYSNHLGLENDPISVGNPMVVARQGDRLDKVLRLPIQDLSIYDPVSNTCPAAVVYWAGLGGTDSAIVVSIVP